MTKQLYDVSVQRTAWGYKTIRVEAEDEVGARRAALALVGDLEFSTSDFEYDSTQTVLVPPPEPPMHETNVEHRFQVGDAVFVRVGGTVVKAKIDKVVAHLLAGRQYVEYQYLNDCKHKITDGANVFATAEEAFK